MPDLDALKISNARKRDIATASFLLIEVLLEDAQNNENLPPDLIKKFKSDLNKLHCVEQNLATSFLLADQRTSLANN